MRISATEGFTDDKGETALDIAILLAIAVVLVVLAWIGIRVSLRLPSDKTRKQASETRFVLLALLGLGLLFWSGFRSVNVRAEIAERLRSVNSKLASMGPRTMAPDVRQAIVDYLEGAPPHGKVKVMALKGDAEAANYADSWLAILRAAGWEPVPGVFFADASTAVPGVAIAVQSGETPGAAVLQHAFSMAGVEAAGAINGAEEPNMIELIVGKKP